VESNAGTPRREGCLVARVELVGGALVAIGFALRLYHGLGSYVNPDEALHYIGAHRVSLIEAYRSSLHTAHPPLYFLTLHLALALGTSEFFLRLPSLLGSAAALWFAFRWLQRSASAAIAVAATAFLVFSPAMIATGAEARQYGLLMCFMCAGLYSLERSFSDCSRRWVAVFAASLYGAILSHYTAAWVTLTLGVYALVRAWSDRPPRPVVAAWVVSQLGAAALYSWLYTVHLSIMRGGGIEATAINGWLKYQYYRPGAEDPAGFVGRGLDGAFAYLAGGPRLGVAAVLLFVAGLMIIVVRPPNGMRRDFALLLGLPVVFGLIGALSGLLPFGSTRHMSYLLPFIAAGAAVSVATLLRGQLALTVLAVLVGGPLWVSHTQPANAVGKMPARDMKAVLAYLDAAMPVEAVLFTDGQTHLVLTYYLQPDEVGLRLRSGPGVNDTQFGRFRIVSLPQSWSFRDDNVTKDALQVSQALGLERGAPLWIMTVGWPVGETVAKWLPAPAVVSEQRFGDISVVQTAVGFLGDAR
jgi:hypothetical protein